MKKTRFISVLIVGLLFVSGCSVVNQVKRQYDKVSGSPEVQSITPQNGATNVPLDAQVEVMFSTEMDENTMNAKGVIISYENEDLVVFLNPFLNSEYEYNADERKLVVTPSQKFIPGQEVKVTLTDAVRSIDGKQLPTGTDASGSERYIFRFNTQQVAGEQQDVAENQLDDTVPTTDEVKNASFDALAAENLVKDFMITQSETYKFDGKAETLTIEKITPVGCVGCFDVVMSFVSKNQGYGDRSSLGLSSGDTFHQGIIEIENGEIVMAVLDETWDMVAQEPL
jgi:hypothetical protein